MSHKAKVQRRFDRWVARNPAATEAERDRKARRIAERLLAQQAAEEEARRLEEARRREAAEEFRKKEQGPAGEAATNC